MIRTVALVLVLAVTASIQAEEPRKVAKPANEGKTFFQDNVLPRLAENGCPLCHTVGYLRPNVMVYEDLLPYLGMGDSPDNAVVIYKIANLRSIAPDRPTHPGGKRCPTPDSEPCKTLKQWWTVEFGTATKTR